MIEGFQEYFQSEQPCVTDCGNCPARELVSPTKELAIMAVAEVIEGRSADEILLADPDSLYKAAYNSKPFKERGFSQDSPIEVEYILKTIDRLATGECPNYTI